MVPETTFLLNGQRFVDNGLLRRQRRVFTPTDSSDFEQHDFRPTGDSGVVAAPRSSRRWCALGKVSNSSISDVRLDYQAFGTQRRRPEPELRLPPQPRRRADAARDLVRPRRRRVAARDLEPAVLRRRPAAEHVRLQATTPSRAWARPPTAPACSTRSQRTRRTSSPRSRSGRRTTTRRHHPGRGPGPVRPADQRARVQGRRDGQPTNIHLLKAGLEFQRSAIDFGVPGRVAALVVDGVQQLGVVRDTPGAEVLQYAPIQAAAFVQDRIEWGDLRVRAGLRLSYFDAHSTVPSDLAKPGQLHRRRARVSPRRHDAQGGARAAAGRVVPVPEAASLFFSYGHFYQTPRPRHVLLQRRLLGPARPAGRRGQLRRARQSGPGP